MVLKDADVRRARVSPDGAFEIEFIAAPEEVPTRNDDEPAVIQPTRKPADAEAKHPGYGKLFGGAFPAFKPVTEPQKAA